MLSVLCCQVDWRPRKILALLKKNSIETHVPFSSFFVVFHYSPVSGYEAKDDQTRDKIDQYRRVRKR